MRNKALVLLVCCIAAWSVDVEAVVSGGTVKRSAPRRLSYDNITPNNRTYCPTEEGNIPAERVNTTARLAALRVEMTQAVDNSGTPEAIDAYIIQYGDQHMSGGVAYDKRLKYISGFTGSSGFAIVLKDKAALWTDGRYFTQADLEMDCNWILMKIDTEGYPTGPEWITDQLGSATPIGAAPQLTSINTWQAYEQVSNSFKEVTDELIDRIWTTDREARPNNEIYEHTIEYAGETWAEKLAQVRSEMTTDVLVITALDETAWLFNLRGSDYPTSPLFYSYGMVMEDEVRLYLLNHTVLISGLLQHLNTNADGSCTGKTGECVNVRDYENIRSDLEDLDQAKFDSISISPTSSYAIYSSTGDRRRTQNSPIQLIKSIKNEVERRRYFECQVRDSSYLIEFIADLEKRIQAGEEFTELSAAEKLTQTRSQDEAYRMDSFTTISAVGANAAIIHYRPSDASNAKITTDDVYLLDSGGNYLDGTTDVTRTFHFGTPKPIEIEAYTRVLMGVIDLATTVWPEGLRGSELDSRTRTPLWQNGWDFNHGTGHGIGYFLNVHEGPARIAVYSSNADYSPLYAGMFFSDEPGYYEVGEYGIRLETIVGVEEANVPNKFDDKTYLTFRAATLVPFEPNLIDYSMLNQHHRKFLNTYNARCKEEVGKLLAGKDDALAWLDARTQHIPDEPNWDDPITGASPNLQAWGFCVFAGLLLAKLL